jgi:outer membrane protein assembly factor BamB
MLDRSAAVPRVYWRTPIIIVICATALIAFLHFSERVESYIAAYSISILIVVTVIAVLIWFVRSRGFSRRTRRRVTLWFLAIVVFSAAAVKLTTRREGVLNGIGFPRLVWRWSPRADADLPAIAGSRQPVDLATTTSQDFPEFLGPGRHNAVDGVALSRDWSKPPKLLWHRRVGLGWSSFAVVGNFAVTQEQRGESELVVCYDIATGEPRWSHAHDHTRFVDSQGGDGPRATPTILGGRVYAMGATGILDCLDGATGSPIWSVNVIPNPDRNFGWGKSCSPLIVDDLVIVTGGKGGPSLLAYGLASGLPAWSVGRESTSYASPILTTFVGMRQIISVNADSVASYAPVDGRMLWTFNWPGSMPKNIQPMPLDNDRLLISAGYGLGTTVLKISDNNGSFSARPMWTSRRLKPKLTNNAIVGRYVFGLDDPGVMTCLDLALGERMWRDGAYGFGQLLRVDDLILVECESGEVALIDPRPDALHELGRFTALQTRTWSGPALSGHRLLVRNDQEAACYELP